jgi:hypothetical protein
MTERVRPGRRALGDRERQSVEGVKGWRVFDVQDAASRLVHRLRRRMNDERTHPDDAPDIGEALGGRL